MAWVSWNLCLGLLTVLLAGCGNQEEDTTAADCGQYLKKYKEKHISELADVEPEHQSSSWDYCKRKAVEALKLEHEEEDNFSNLPLFYVFALLVCSGVMKIYLVLEDNNTKTKNKKLETLFDTKQAGEMPAMIAPLLNFTSFLYWHLMPSMLLLMGFFADSCIKGMPAWVYLIYAIFAMAHVAVYFTLVRQWNDGGINGAPIFESFALLQIGFFSMLEHVDLGSDVLAMGVAGACHDEAIHLWRKAWTRSLGSFGAILVPMFVYMGMKGYCALLFFHFSWFPQAHGLSLVSGTAIALMGFMISCLLSGFCAWLHKVAWWWLAYALAGILWLVYAVASGMMTGAVTFHDEGKNPLYEKCVETMFLEHYAGFMVTDFVPAEHYLPINNEVASAKTTLRDAEGPVGPADGEEERLAGMGAAAVAAAAATAKATAVAAVAAEAMVATGSRVAQEIRAVLARLLLENCVQLVTQSMFFALTQHILSAFAVYMQLASMAVSFFTTCHKLIKLFIKVGKIDKTEVEAFCSTLFMMLIATLVLLFCPMKVIMAYKCFHWQEGVHKKPATWNLSGDGCVYDDEL